MQEDSRLAKPKKEPKKKLKRRLKKLYIIYLLSLLGAIKMFFKGLKNTIDACFL